jgi:hypothetical protein
MGSLRVKLWAEEERFFILRARMSPAAALMLFGSNLKLLASIVRAAPRSGAVTTGCGPPPQPATRKMARRNNPRW